LFYFTLSVRIWWWAGADIPYGFKVVVFYPYTCKNKKTNKKKKQKTVCF